MCNIELVIGLYCEKCIANDHYRRRRENNHGAMNNHLKISVNEALDSKDGAIIK